MNCPTYVRTCKAVKYTTYKLAKVLLFLYCIYNKACRKLVGKHAVCWDQFVHKCHSWCVSVRRSELGKFFIISVPHNFLAGLAETGKWF